MENTELIKYEVKKGIDEIRSGIDQNVNNQIRSAILKTQEFLRSAAVEANNRMVNENKVT